MPRRPPLSPARRAAAAALLVVAAGCGADPQPVAVELPDAGSPGVDAVCSRLAAELPARIDGDPRRATAPASELTAAWGDPAVVLRCGVERPAGLTATSHLEGVNDVEWLLLERPGERVFTTIGRAAYIEVTIPLEHEPAVGPLVDVAAAVRAAAPARAEVFR